jgi:hypothetical protein
VRSYTGRWIDQTSGWGVDLKADMKDYASEPRLVDYSYGIHVHWTSEQRSLSGEELEEWLDSGLVWRVIGERDVVHLRASLAAALSRKATLTLHVVVPNGALRSMLPALADARPEAYTRPLALAMPWMEMFEERRSAPRRRDAYAPLWAMYLEDPSQSRSVYAAAAEAHLAKQGATALAHREAQAGDPDPFTFAGLTAINGDTRGACDAFTRGARILREAILSGARNQKTIDKVFGAMNDLWAQSHHVRAVGAYLLDCAEAASVLHEVTRTLTVEADGLPDMIVVTA